MMDPRVRGLYKKLLWIGRDYPQGYDYFKKKLKSGFKAQSSLLPDQIPKALERGEYIYKEIEALIFLHRYRELKRRYYSDSHR